MGEISRLFCWPLPTQCWLLRIMGKKPLGKNMVGKGEKAGDQHFLLYRQCFLPYLKKKKKYSIWATLKLLSANAFKLDMAKILSSGKCLRAMIEELNQSVNFCNIVDKTTAGLWPVTCIHSLKQFLIFVSILLSPTKINDHNIIKLLPSWFCYFPPLFTVYYHLLVIFVRKLIQKPFHIVNGVLCVSVLQCSTRNPGILGSSCTGSSGFFRGVSWVCLVLSLLPNHSFSQTKNFLFFQNKRVCRQQS